QRVRRQLERRRRERRPRFRHGMDDRRPRKFLEPLSRVRLRRRRCRRVAVPRAGRVRTDRGGQRRGAVVSPESSGRRPGARRAAAWPRRRDGRRRASAREAAAPVRVGEGPMLTLSGLSKSYGSRRVLDGLDLAIEAGESVAMLGANGSGKTTTLRTIVG